MNKDKIFEEIKTVFKKWSKEDIIEYISAVITELLLNGVSIGECETTPPYIEYVTDKGLLQREYANCGSMLIRKQLTLSFVRHDEEIKERLMKELSENITETEDSDFYREQFNEIELKCAKLEIACLDKDAEIEQLKRENEGYKKVFENTREEINKKENDIFQLNECNGRLQAIVDTYRNFVLPRATAEARRMIDDHRYSEVQIVVIGEENKECDCQIAEQQDRTDKGETELERAKNTINQIDDILEKLFGIRHDTVDKPDGFEDVLTDKMCEKVEYFIPERPIEVAGMLIKETGKSCLDKYSISDLRQIAEHLLVYCNHNGEVEE